LGDLADWYPQGPGPNGNDSFNDYAYNGVLNSVSPNDITLMNSLGYTSVTTPYNPGSYANVVEAMYIGYFGRAGDPSGDAYWLNEMNSGQITESGMAASFSVQNEATAEYPYLANPEGATVSQIDQFIAQVYQNLFNRVPDASGEAYWQNQLEQEPLAKFIERGEFSLCSRGGAAGAQAGAGLSCVTRSI